jgi:hypothetical protein
MCAPVEWICHFNSRAGGDSIRTRTYKQRILRHDNGNGGERDDFASVSSELAL